MLGIFRGVKDCVDNIQQIWDSGGILSFGVLALQLFDNRMDKRYCFTQIPKFLLLYTKRWKQEPTNLAVGLMIDFFLPFFCILFLFCFACLELSCL